MTLKNVVQIEFASSAESYLAALETAIKSLEAQIKELESRRNVVLQFMEDEAAK